MSSHEPRTADVNSEVLPRVVSPNNSRGAHVISQRKRKCVGYNLGRAKIPPLIVHRPCSRFVFLMAAILVFSAGIVAQKAGAASQPWEQTALQRGLEALRKGDLAEARSEFEKAVRLAPNDAAAQA